MEKDEKTRRIWLEIDEELGEAPGWKMIMDGLLFQASIPGVKRAVIKILGDDGEFEIEVRKTADPAFPESERIAEERIGDG